MITLAPFPGSSAWAERKEPGTHCLRMLSSPRISGNLEISVKSAPLHQPPQGKVIWGNFGKTSGFAS